MIKPQEILGKPVREKYGRFSGVVVACESNLLEEVTAIIYNSNGLLIRTESNSFIFDGKEVEVAPSAIIESKKLYKELSILLIRLQSLFKLKKSNLMSEKSFRKIKNDLSSVYKALNDKSVTLLEKLRTREQNLADRKEWMYSLFMNLEISRRLKWINDEQYMKSYEQLEKELFRISNEIDDIKQAKIDLESVLNELRKLVIEEKVVEEAQEIEAVKPMSDEPKAEVSKVEVKEEAVREPPQ